VRFDFCGDAADRRDAVDVLVFGLWGGRRCCGLNGPAWSSERPGNRLLGTLSPSKRLQKRSTRHDCSRPRATLRYSGSTHPGSCSRRQSASCRQGCRSGSSESGSYASFTVVTGRVRRPPPIRTRPARMFVLIFMLLSLSVNACGLHAIPPTPCRRNSRCRAHAAGSRLAITRRSTLKSMSMARRRSSSSIR
jgi:hypothetical protein